MWLREQIDKKKGHHVEYISKQPVNQQSFSGSTGGYNGPMSVLEDHQNDLAMWNMIERNNFLE